MSKWCGVKTHMLRPRLSNLARRHGVSSPAAGLTLIELLIAMTVLVIGLPACMMMLLIGMQTN